MMKLMGAEQMAARIRAFAKAYPDRVASALYVEGSIELTEMKQRTPVSPTPAPKGVIPGALRASARMVIERAGKIIKAIFSFGGPSVDYAVVQHERLDYIHTTGQAKYMESVLDESGPHMMNRLGARLRLDGNGEAGE